MGREHIGILQEWRMHSHNITCRGKNILSNDGWRRPHVAICLMN